MSTVVDDDAGPVEPSAAAAADDSAARADHHAGKNGHPYDDRARRAHDDGVHDGRADDGGVGAHRAGAGQDAPAADDAAADDAAADDAANDDAANDDAANDDADAAPGDALDGGPAGDDPTDDSATDDSPARTVAADPGSSGAQVVQDAPAPTPAQLRIDFGAHLEANYRRLVAQLYAITLDPAEAHSAVQDAYSRAWRSWTTVSRSPDATGWIRRVAVRSTVRSWRRLRPRSRLVGPGPNTRTGAMLAALRRLPAPERRCIVLHHMAGASLQEIAAVEGVSLGTTAARLARAQQVVGTNLADLLSDDFGPDPSSDALDEWAAPRWDVLQPATSGTADHEEDRP